MEIEKDGQHIQTATAGASRSYDLRPGEYDLKLKLSPATWKLSQNRVKIERGKSETVRIVDPEARPKKPGG